MDPLWISSFSIQGETLANKMAQCDEAVEMAAHHLQRKEEKQHKKHNNNHDHHHQQQKATTNDEQQCDCIGVKLKVEQGKDSTIIKSPMANRKWDRRQGVAEKNDTERKLVKECVKVMTRTTNLNDFNLL